MEDSYIATSKFGWFALVFSKNMQALLKYIKYTNQHQAVNVFVNFRMVRSPHSPSPLAYPVG